MSYIGQGFIITNLKKNMYKTQTQTWSLLNIPKSFFWNLNIPKSSKFKYMYKKKCDDFWIFRNIQNLTYVQKQTWCVNIPNYSYLLPSSYVSS